MQTLLLASFEAVTGLPDLFADIFLFVFGAAIGSFLNVVIYRVPNEMSVVMPNSACPNCKKAIRFYDNIPVIGWLLLRGQCRDCKEPISWRYPAVEMLTGVLFLLTYWQLGFNAFLPVGLIFVAAMIALIFIDAEHMILPNVITYPLLVLALVVRFTFPMFTDPAILPDMKSIPSFFVAGYPPWLMSTAAALFGALVGGGSLWLVGEIWKRIRGVDAMGLGDVKMMFAVGALLGWRLTVLTIFCGAFAGAVVGSILVLRQKDKDLQTMIPFGVFLGLGAIVALLFGERMIAWYMDRFIS